jgi:hypothetical protein
VVTPRQGTHPTRVTLHFGRPHPAALAKGVSLLASWTREIPTARATRRWVTLGVIAYPIRWAESIHLGGSSWVGHTRGVRYLTSPGWDITRWAHPVRGSARVTGWEWSTLEDHLNRPHHV